MIVVADASVLIALSSIGYLYLIQDKFASKILIPPAVRKEVVEQGGDRPGSHQVSKADWINVHELKNKDISRILKMELDEGESESIALADELKADVVLLDEKDARRVAKQLGLKVLGTIGILARPPRLSPPGIRLRQSRWRTGVSDGGQASPDKNGYRFAKRQRLEIRGRNGGMEGILTVHSYQTACTCGYSIIFLSFVKSIKL